jgi:glucose-6-phosphate isomerase
LCKINIDQLQKGAKLAVSDCVSKDLNKNKAMISAISIYLHSQKGKNIHNTFLFNPELESLGKWYRQLMAESIGKRKNSKGKIVRAGITPIVSIGSTDLHSMAQLYFGGPNDKFTNIVFAKQKNGVKISNLEFGGLAEGIENKSFENIMRAIVGGVKAAYEKNKLPFIDIALNEISEKSLGYYLQFRMIEIMYLARLLQVNAFDQPNVEDYKKETRKLLKK